MPTSAAPAPDANASAVPLQHKLSETRSLLGALEAVTRWRPFLMLALTFLACVLLVAVFGGIGAALARQSGFLAGLLGVLTLLLVMGTALVGVNAAGIMLSDDTWGRPQRNMVAALLASLFTSHRLIGILLLQGLMFLLYLVVFSIVLFICSIPGIGPLLYAVVFPLGAVLTGVVLFTLLYVAIPLAAPAVWNNATVMQALAMLAVVARKRLLFVVVMTLLLGLLLLIVTLIVAAILSSGTAMTLALSASIVGASLGGLDGLGGLLMGAMGGMGGRTGSAYLWALGFGTTILFLLGVAPGMLVGMKGATIIHRAALEGLSVADTEQAMSAQFDVVKRRALEAKEQALKQVQPALPAQAQSTSPPAPDSAPTAAAALSCPSCNHAVSADDVFCGHCGHKLK